MKFILNITILSIVIALQCSSCKKFTEVDPPKDRVVISEAFKTDESATAAVAGIYSKMLISGNYTSGLLTFYGGLSADELRINNSSSLSSDAAGFYNNQISPASGILAGMWSSNYSIIGQSNICIENLSSDVSASLTPAVRSELLGEAKFLRALMYFYMVNTFGNVPLVLTSDWQASMKLGRSPSSDVYKQIVADLKDAQNVLPEDYITGDKVRANKFAATALLARIYLYQKQYADAIELAGQVINSGKYSLSDVSGVFLANSDEAILQFQPLSNTGINTVEGSMFIPSFGGQPTFALTSQLLNDFESGDLRKSNWTKAYTSGSTQVYYPYKYKMGYNSKTLTEYVMVLRLAELYLIRAEAYANTNMKAEAIADLNTIRDRARDNGSATPLAALDANGMSNGDVINAVAHERRIELFAEWGHRWLDLKRTGEADAVLQPIKSGYTSNSQLFPIPKQEILVNPQLIQNEGY